MEGKPTKSFRTPEGNDHAREITSKKKKNQGRIMKSGSFSRPMVTMKERQESNT